MFEWQARRELRDICQRKQRPAKAPGPWSSRSSERPAHCSTMHSDCPRLPMTFKLCEPILGCSQSTRAIGLDRAMRCLALLKQRGSGRFAALPSHASGQLVVAVARVLVSHGSPQ